jgi:glycosyltransferase involved in cell wall biosynthesis
LFVAATALVAPSLHDPSPIVHAEADAGGIPSIASPNGGAAKNIGDGDQLVDPEDQKQLLSAIVKLRDPQRACGLGRRALERAELLMWRLVAGRLVWAARIPGGDTASLADYL